MSKSLDQTLSSIYMKTNPLEEKMLTFDEWQERGYVVVKGEKSHERNKFGEAVFTWEQVTTKKKTYRGGTEYNDFDLEDDPFQDPYIFN